MVALVLGVLGLVVWGDIRTAVYIFFGYMMAKSIINACNKHKDK